MAPEIKFTPYGIPYLVEFSNVTFRSPKVVSRRRSPGSAVDSFAGTTRSSPKVRSPPQSRSKPDRTSSLPLPLPIPFSNSRPKARVRSYTVPQTPYQKSALMSPGACASTSELVMGELSETEWIAVPHPSQTEKTRKHSPAPSMCSTCESCSSYSSSSTAVNESPESYQIPLEVGYEHVVHDIQYNEHRQAAGNGRGLFIRFKPLPSPPYLSSENVSSSSLATSATICSATTCGLSTPAEAISCPSLCDIATTTTFGSTCNSPTQGKPRRRSETDSTDFQRLNFNSHQTETHTSELRQLSRTIAQAVLAAGMTPHTNGPDPRLRPDKALYQGTYGQVLAALAAAGLTATPCAEDGVVGTTRLGAMFIGRNDGRGVLELVRITLWG